MMAYFGKTNTPPAGSTWNVAGYSVHLEADAHLPYQWVNTATDYDADPSKFPAYLRFDGVDDALQTGNIDFTGTDKMTVWAGVTKLSDAAAGTVVEAGSLAAPVGGEFLLAAPNAASASAQFASAGSSVSAATYTNALIASPASLIMTGIGNIGADQSILRIDGVQTTSSVVDQGTGNYGNHINYVGGRAASSRFFNGRLYSLIIRGAQSSLSQIEAAERYIKQKMRMP